MQTRRSNYQTPVATEVAYPSDLAVADRRVDIVHTRRRTTDRRPG